MSELGRFRFRFIHSLKTGPIKWCQQLPKPIDKDKQLPSSDLFLPLLRGEEFGCVLFSSSPCLWVILGFLPTVSCGVDPLIWQASTLMFSLRKASPTTGALRLSQWLGMRPVLYSSMPHAGFGSTFVFEGYEKSRSTCDDAR